MRSLKFIIQLIKIVLSVFYYGGITLISPNRKKVDHFYKIAKKWGLSILRIAGVKLEIIGIENVNPNENYVFVSNHSSLFDIPVLQYALPCNFRIVYKRELEKIPFFGYVLIKSPYIGIVREDSKDAMKGMKQAIEDFQKGASVLLFPEGTRSEDGNLQDFKRGAFMLASKSQKPIVPVTIVGSNKILPKGKFSFVDGIVKVIIHKPVQMPQNASKKDELEIQNQVFDIINKTLQENRV